MMAFDPDSNTTALDSSTVNALRVALARSVAMGDHGEELQALLRRAATEARTKGVQAEHLLIALKDIWYSLPGLSTHRGDDVQTRLLQQLIARCIQDYYAT